MRDGKLVNISANTEMDWGFLRREVISVTLVGNKSMYLMAVVLVTQKVKKAEVLYAFSTSVFTSKDIRKVFRNLRTQKPGRKCGARRTYPWWKRIRLENN